jgi:hypothetical protein
MPLSLQLHLGRNIRISEWTYKILYTFIIWNMRTDKWTMHPHYAFIVCNSCKESKNGAANNKITQLEVSIILENNSASVGNLILTFRGNVVSSSSTFRPPNSKTLCCLEKLGPVYPVTASYLRWTDDSATPARKLQNSHNAICRYSERMKVSHTIIFISTRPPTFLPGRCSYYSPYGEGPTTITHTSSVEKSPCEETAQMVKEAPTPPSTCVF